ncbi:MAG: lipopolysaccharide biosynthesis protein [Planctomycetota bacterium]
MIAARTLSPELTGRFTITLVVTQTIALLLNCGIGASSLYLVRSGRLEREVGAALQFVWWVLVSAALWVAVLVAPVAHLRQVEGFLGATNLRYALLLPIPLLCSQILLPYFQAQRRFLTLNVLWAAGPLIWVVAVAAGCSRASPTVEELLAWTLGTWLLGAALSASAFLVVARPAFARLAGARREAVALLRLGLLGNLGLILTQLNNRADLLLVGVYLGDARAAVYAVAAFAAEAVNLASAGIATVAFPDAVERFAIGERSHELTGRLFRAATYAAIALGSMVLLSVWWLVSSALRPDYRDALVPLAVLLLGTVPYSAGRILAVELSSLGRFDLNCWTSGAALGMNVTLTALLAPRFGLLGAAVGSALGYWLHVGLLLSWHARLRGTPWAVLRPQPMADARIVFSWCRAH